MSKISNSTSLAQTQPCLVRRTFAYLIDFVLVLILAVFVASVTTGIGQVSIAINNQSDVWTFSFINGSYLLLVWTAYFTTLECCFKATLGKKLLGLKIVTAEGVSPSLEQLFKRNIFKTFEFLTLNASLVLIDENNQSLSDKWAGTFVTRNQNLAKTKLSTKKNSLRKLLGAVILTLCLYFIINFLYFLPKILTLNQLSTQISKQLEADLLKGDISRFEQELSKNSGISQSELRLVTSKYIKLAESDGNLTQDLQIATNSRWSFSNGDAEVLRVGEYYTFRLIFRNIDEKWNLIGLGISDT